MDEGAYTAQAEGREAAAYEYDRISVPLSACRAVYDSREVQKEL